MELFNKNISLEIILDDDFNGIMYGLPEVSLGCKLKGKIVLKNKEPITAKILLFTVLGKISVACGPPMSSSRPEYSESQIMYQKQCIFHDSATSSKKIHAGTHEYHFDLDLPGNLPASFKRARGKIEYSCNALLMRPIFCNNIEAKRTIYIKRCLMDEITPHNTTFTEGVLNDLIRYQINTPIITFREGGLVEAELLLKSTNSDIVIEAVEYGLKEQIHYRTTGDRATTVVASVNEDRFPLGKRKLSTGSHFFTDTEPITIDFRLCPWVNCDTDSPLINIHHKLSFTVCISEPSVEPAEMEDVLSEVTFPRHSRNNRRFSVPTPSSHSDFDDLRQINEPLERRTNRPLSLLSSFSNNTRNNSRFSRMSRNSRTFSIKTIRSNHAQNKIDHNLRLHFDVPIIITTKSLRRNQAPPYVPVDQPPDYAIASMIPPPPEYNDSNILEYLSHETEEDSYHL